MNYSQHDEQRYILEAVGEARGRFLDIGAYDGIHFSNVLALIERGWEGLLVEPGLEAFDALLKNHGKNERLSLIHAAVGLKAGLVPFWDTPDLLSTVNACAYDRWANYANYRPAFYTPTVMLNDILKTFPGPVDFVNIDTEGSSAELFLEFPLALLRPRAACVEHDGIAPRLCQHARDCGYHLIYGNDENVVFARNQ